MSLEKHTKAIMVILNQNSEQDYFARAAVCINELSKLAGMDEMICNTCADIKSIESFREAKYKNNVKVTRGVCRKCENARRSLEMQGITNITRQKIIDESKVVKTIGRPKKK